MNNLDKQYTDLLQTILEHGVEKKDRTGTGTRSIFGYTIRHNMRDGFPLLTTKRMYFAGIVTELLWFLRGDTNIKFLVDNDCHIWDGDAYKNYCTAYKDGYEFYEDEQVKRCFTQEEFITKIKTDDQFAEKWGELGPIYGKQWRSWTGYESNTKVNGVYDEYVVDQIANLINDLKTNPDSRRLMVNAWNPAEIDQMVLPPCHYGFQVYTRELSTKERWEWYSKNGDENGEIKLIGMIIYENEEDNSHIKSWLEKHAPNVPKRAISLMWNQRSVDTFLGLPFNIASYGLLLEIIAKAVNMVPDELIGNLGDTHLYLNHLAAAQEQLGRDTTFEEKLRWVMQNTDVEMENLAITERAHGDDVPTRTRQPYPLPTLNINTEFWPTQSGECGVGPLHSDIEVLIQNMQIDDFQIEGYISHPTIKAPLNN